MHVDIHPFSDNTPCSADLAKCLYTGAYIKSHIYMSMLMVYLYSAKIESNRINFYSVNKPMSLTNRRNFIGLMLAVLRSVADPES